MCFASNRPCVLKTRISERAFSIWVFADLRLTSCIFDLCLTYFAQPPETYFWPFLDLFFFFRASTSLGLGGLLFLEARWSSPLFAHGDSDANAAQRRVSTSADICFSTRYKMNAMSKAEATRSPEANASCTATDDHLLRERTPVLIQLGTQQKRFKLTT